jgi:hypothetical protein
LRSSDASRRTSDRAFAGARDSKPPDTRAGQRGLSTEHSTRESTQHTRELREILDGRVLI